MTPNLRTGHSETLTMFPTEKPHAILLKLRPGKHRETHAHTDTEILRGREREIHIYIYIET